MKRNTMYWINRG